MPVTTCSLPLDWDRGSLSVNNPTSAEHLQAEACMSLQFSSVKLEESRRNEMEGQEMELLSEAWEALSLARTIGLVILAISSQNLGDFAQLEIRGQSESDRLGLVWILDGLKPGCVLIWEGEA